MRHIILLSLSLFLATSCAINKNPKAGLELKYTSNDGTNGMSVAYHEANGNYYAVIGGNESFPLEAFDTKGKSLGSKSIGFDARALWYNPYKKQLEGNTYNNNGLYVLDVTPGAIFPLDPKMALDNTNQPDEQASAAFDYSDAALIYYENGEVYSYSRDNGLFLKKLRLTAIPCSLYDLNSTTIIYTGIKSNEYGLLNYVKKEVYLFDKTSGKLSTTITLPDDAKASDSFRFSYSNKRIWLYDTDNRIWTGYKIK